MIASEIIKQGMDLGVYLYAENGNLAFKLTQDEFPEDFKQQVLANKLDILDYLQKHTLDSDEGPKVRSEDFAQYPLSAEQESFWFIGQQDKNSGQYNLPIVYELAAHINLEQVENAFNHVLDKQVVLKTNYRNVQGKPVQFVRDHTLAIPSIDVEERELKAKIGGAMLAPFDLENDNMLRVQLFCASGKRYLLICLNHISTDNFGMSIMLSDFFAAYRALGEGKSGVLERPEIDYFDYSNWQNERKEAHKFDAQVSYWQSKFENIPLVHSVPLEAARPAVQSYAGKEHLGKLNGPQMAEIEAYCLSNRITKNLFFQSLYSILLGYVSGAEHVVFGCPVDRRQFKSLEPLVGCFTNTIVNNNHYDKSLSLTQYIKDCEKTFHDDLANADVPYNQVVSAVNPERSASYQPLHQIRFTFIGKGTDNSAQTLGFSIAEGDLEQSKFDFSLQVKESHTEVLLSWLYCKDIMFAPRMAALNDCYQGLIKQVLSDDSLALGELELLTASQKQTMLGWSQGKQAPVGDLNVAQRLATLGFDKSAQTALTYDGEQLSYGELMTRVQNLSQQLQTQFPETELFGIYAGRGLNSAIAILATLSCGKGYVPLARDMPMQRIQDIVADAKLEVVLVGDSKMMASGSSFGAVQLVDVGLGANTPVQKQVTLSAPVAQDTAYIIYTSGSTGKPKGVVVSYANLSNFEVGFEEQMTHVALKQNDAWLWNASIAFDASLKGIVALLGGHPLVIPTDEQVVSPTDILALVQKHQMPVVNFTPLFMTGFVDHLVSSETRCDLIVSGDEVSATLWRKLNDYKTKFDCQVLNAYGPTEGTVNASYGIVDGAGTPKIGSPTVNTQLYVLSDNLKMVPPGVVGELYIGGSSVTGGYLNLADATQQAFVANPMKAGETIYRTGDFARYTVDGELEFYGRKDNQVKYRGYRIELEDIASQVNSYLGVAECAVLLLGKDEFTKRIVAFVNGPQASVEPEILAHVAKELPSYMLPSRFVFVDTIAKTLGGKVDSQALIAHYGTLKQKVETNKPSGDLTSQLADIWSALLEKTDIQPADSFFALGGHSLLAMKLLAQMNEKFNVVMEIPELFQHITLEQQVSFIEENGYVVENADTAQASSETTTASPVAAIRPRLSVIWCEILEINEVEDDSHFFVLGGHSLLAMKLLSEMQNEFGHTMEITDLFSHVEFGLQVRWLEEATASDSADSNKSQSEVDYKGFTVANESELEVELEL